MLVSTLIPQQSALAAPDIKLPFAGGSNVAIIQGYNGGTHTGVERYSLDLKLIGAESANAPVLAPATGKVVWFYPPGTATGCFGLELNDGSDLYVMLCHLILDRPFTDNELIQRGQRVGYVAPAGMVGNNGSAHIHMQLYRLPNGGFSRTPVPFVGPDGAALDGQTLPSSGSTDQWGCPTFPACPRIVSSNGPAPATPTRTPTPTPRPNTTVTPTATRNPALTAGFVVRGTDSCLRLRETPSTGARVIGCLPEGEPVAVVDGPREAEGRMWVKLDNGGWVAADFLSPASGSSAPTATPTPIQTPSATPAASPTPTATPRNVDESYSGEPANATVASGGVCLNIRTRPSRDAATVTCVADGERVRLTGEEAEGDGLTWVRVSGRGWAAKDYIQPD